MTAPTTPDPTQPAGATPPADPAPLPAPPAAGTPADEPLGEAGKKALQAERDARAALEKEIARLKPLADLLGGKPTGDTKSDLEKLTERMAELETAAATERLGRLRLEVATEKGLTPAQAARLQGTSRDELAADADALLALFPAAPAASGTPKPDPSQGAKGTATDIDARIADAEAKGDLRTAFALKAQKLTTK